VRLPGGPRVAYYQGCRSLAGGSTDDGDSVANLVQGKLFNNIYCQSRVDEQRDGNQVVCFSFSLCKILQAFPLFALVKNLIY
jgi:hypothetical protein